MTEIMKQDKQALLITDSILKLNSLNTSVSLSLDESLDSELRNELISKGYTVYTYDHSETNNGTTISTHTVDIALPSDIQIQNKFNSFGALRGFRELEPFNRMPYNSYRRYRSSYRSTHNSTYSSS